MKTHFDSVWFDSIEVKLFEPIPLFVIYQHREHGVTQSSTEKYV